MKWCVQGCGFLFLLTYLLTPWSRVFLEKLTCFQLVKKLPEFYGTRRFITAVTNARHLSLSWASSTQSIPPHPTSWRSVFFSGRPTRLMCLDSILLIYGCKTGLQLSPLDGEPVESVWWYLFLLQVALRNNSNSSWRRTVTEQRLYVPRRSELPACLKGGGGGGGGGGCGIVGLRRWRRWWCEMELS